MSRSKAFVWSLTICFFMHLHSGSSAIKKSRDSLRIKEGLLFIDKNSFDEGNLIFAVCDKNTTRETKCNIVQKVYPDKNNTRSCNVTLKGNHVDSRLNIRIGVVSLGKTRAILFWGENHNNVSIAKIGTVDLETCKMNEVTIDDPGQEVLLEMFYSEKMVAYNDTSFHVFFNASKHCGHKLCVMQINKDGTVEGKTMTSNLSANGYVQYIAPIASRSPSKGFAYMRSKNSLEYTLTLVKLDGTEKQLDSYETTARPTVSASRNVVSACTKDNVDSDITCTQYDENGKIKFMVNIPEEYKNTQSRAVHNLPDGGILVMLAEMTHCDQLLNCDETNYHMVRISPNGKLLGIARIEEFDNVTSQWKYNYVYKYGDSEYCAALIGQNPILNDSRLSNYEILYHCVTEKEFLM